ncbi:phosphotransferase enzyme family protein [Demetria terragena]|uniref:phosphotransferase enzyme family protein n=1 Tax=Demetria terragena TaxID=63959 RepID=UPI00037DCE63|nr:phosphotransferase [Demetria terragena]
MEPEMLWEDAEPKSALTERFGFASARDATRWAQGLLAMGYGLELRSAERLVISQHNLMVWVTTSGGARLIVKICGELSQHASLYASGGLVRWLADRGQPVAAPVLAHGEHQVERDGFSVGVHPVLPGRLLDASDPAQVRAAGKALASLHLMLAQWTDTEAFRTAGAQRPITFAVPDQVAQAKPDLVARVRDLSADVPDLPKQLVHGDFRAANLLVEGGQISGILDFEDARLDAAAVDLAQSMCTIGTWFHDWAPVPQDVRVAYLQAYESVRPLTDAERQWLTPLVGWMMLGLGWPDEAAIVMA